MRREDKRRLPPRLKLALPPDYVLKRDITGYQLYLRQSFGPGVMTRLVAAFFADTTAGEMEDYALSHSRRELI